MYLACGRLSDMVRSGRLFSFDFALSSLAAVFSRTAANSLSFAAYERGSLFIMADSFAVATTFFSPEERGRAMRHLDRDVGRPIITLQNAVPKRHSSILIELFTIWSWPNRSLVLIVPLRLEVTKHLANDSVAEIFLSAGFMEL